MTNYTGDLEDLGIAADIVDGVLQYRPMTADELAARDASKTLGGIKITITDGNGDFIRNDHGATKRKIT